MTTGLVYHPVFLDHDTGAHVERAERLVAIRDTQQAEGLWGRMELLEPEPAEEAALELVHERRYLDFLQRASDHGGGWLDPDTVMSAHSLEASLRASGGAIEAARLVVCLEGGYDLAVPGFGMAGVARLLLGESPGPDPLGASMERALRGERPAASRVIDEAVSLHRR